ncbi:MAG: dihydrolipoyl dehydrogenase [Vampirovibrionales bacterium]
MLDSIPPHIKSLLIIGGGPAGYIAAIRLAQRGFSLTLIESTYVGGTCLNWGCIPSKALIHASNDYYKIRSKALESLGIKVDKVSLDWQKLSTHLDQDVQHLRDGIEARLKRLKVNVIKGKAHFISPTSVEVALLEGGSKVLQADAFVIATGAETLVPTVFQGLDPRFSLSVKEIFDIPALPKRLGIVGAGVIGLELAQAFQRLGVEVHVLDRLSGILPQYDAKLVAILQSKLQKEGITFHFNADITAAVVDEAKNQVTLKISSLLNPEEQKTLTVERLLIAPGRRANTQGLDLENAGVDVHPQSGGILINDALQSSQPHIFAIGDVTHGHPQLAHVASHHGIVLAETLAGKQNGLDALTQIPAVLYTQPELARVGLSLEEATARGYTAKVTRLPFAALGRATIDGISEGQALIVVDDATGAILGAEILSPYADALISQMLQAIELGATVEDVALSVHPHPSLSEAWLEVAERHLGLGIHID